MQIFKNSNVLFLSSVIVVFLPRCLEAYEGQRNLVDVLFQIPEMYARLMFFLSGLFHFFHVHCQSCSLELCVPYLKYVEVC